MKEVGVEIVKTEETEENEIKYLNINVSNSEVERKPDIVRLCADAEILEYVKLGGRESRILQEIRQKIEQMNNIDYVEPVTVDEVLQVIDKYKAESEDKE
jgi:hypothetical protein